MVQMLLDPELDPKKPIQWHVARKSVVSDLVPRILKDGLVLRFGVGDSERIRLRKIQEAYFTSSKKLTIEAVTRASKVCLVLFKWAKAVLDNALLDAPIGDGCTPSTTDEPQKEERKEETSPEKLKAEAVVEEARLEVARYRKEEEEEKKTQKRDVVDPGIITHVVKSSLDANPFLQIGLLRGKRKGIEKQIAELTRAFKQHPGGGERQIGGRKV